jgi:hypothetical protein
MNATLKPASVRDGARAHIDHPRSRARGVAAAERRRYRFTCAAIPLFVCVYVATALGRELEPGQTEIFPFASWSLFTLVPNEVHDYAFRLLAVDENVISPIFYEESGELFGNARNHAAHVTIDLIGRATASGNEAAADEIRRRFELMYFPEARSVRYELTERVYDPLERQRGGAFRSVTSLHPFEMTAP